MNTGLLKFILLVQLMITILSLNLYAENYDHSAGIIGNPEGIGAEYEYRYSDLTGIRLIGLYLPGLNLSKGEYICNLALTAVFHIYDRTSAFDPIILAGVDYSYHHWELKRKNTSGTIHDFTYGGGFGIGYIYSERVRLGLNLWINNDYEIRVTDSGKEKGDRFILFFPLIDISYSF